MNPSVDSTPAGLQKRAALLRRRLFVAALNLATFAGLLVWLASILRVSGWSAIDMAIFACFAVAAPWSVLGVWNAILGVILLQRPEQALNAVAPFAALPDANAPLRGKTAVLMTIRNEDPARAFARIAAVKASLDATGEGGAFSYFVLSDTSEAHVARAEEEAFDRWRASANGEADRLHYRRRTSNEGYKAGNVRDFCDRWGHAFEFMIPLDADSLMSGETILRMTRIGEAHAKIGILQSLVVGAPSRSAFARVFQFGMRHGMRPYTMGSAWWGADCGPFWGHNALVRIKPFAEHCHLPVLPGGPPLGGQIMSHDQVEATFMRRAGFEVRVLPEEVGSYEENPPTLLEFTRRDLRWCQGNMQYFRLLALSGLKPMSRFQLVWAISMFIGVPAWTLIILLSALKPLDGEDISLFPAASALGLYGAFMLMYLAPKLAGFLDVAMTPGGLARYGGGARFARGAATEIVFSLLLAPSVTLRTSLFMLGLLFGKAVTWNGQARDAHALSWSDAARGLWPQTLFGAALAALGLWLAPALLLWSLPLTLGYVLAIPFAVATADPQLGESLARRGLCAIPEEIETPAILAALREGEAVIETTHPRPEPA